MSTGASIQGVLGTGCHSLAATAGAAGAAPDVDVEVEVDADVEVASANDVYCICYRCTLTIFNAFGLVTRQHICMWYSVQHLTVIASP